MNTAEMTTERDRCKTAALAHAATIRTTPALPDYERVRLVALVNTYADCVDALGHTMTITSRPPTSTRSAPTPAPPSSPNPEGQHP